MGQEMTVATGETIFQQGAAGVWVYLVLDGHVRVLRRSDAAREVSLGRMEPGEALHFYSRPGNLR
jgi:CRP-like cAMP-binding protein